MQALQAVTTPVADLAARASQMDQGMLGQAQGSLDGSELYDNEDADDDVFGGSDDDEPYSEVSLTPRKVAAGKASESKPAQQLSVGQSPSKKGIRFAEGTPETSNQTTKVKKVQKKPFANIKDSVYISGNSFDFHGTPLDEEDVLSLAEQGSDANIWAQGPQTYESGDTYVQHDTSQDWWVSSLMHCLYENAWTRVLLQPYLTIHPSVVGSAWVSGIWFLQCSVTGVGLLRSFSTGMR